MINQQTEYKHRVFRLFPGVFISQLTSMILGTVNTMMSGHISNVVLSGVGNADTVLLILVALFEGFAYAGSALTGRYFEQKKDYLASCVTFGSLTMGLIAGIVISLFFFFFREYIIEILFSKAGRDVLSASSEYLLFASFSIPLAFFFTQLSGILRSSGNSIVPMFAGLFANLVNIVLGAHFILGAFGVPGLGARGAGVTLLIARASGIIVLLFGSIWNQCLKRIHFVKFKDLLHHLPAICRIGLPSALETSAFYIARLVLQMIVSALGLIANATYLVFQSLVSLYSLPVDADAIVMFHVMSNYAGSGNKETCRDFTHWSVRFSLLLSVSTSVLILITSRFTPFLYSSSIEITQTASKMLLALAYTMLIWPWTWLMPSFFRGVGNVYYSASVNVGCTWLIRIGMTYILSRYFHLGVYAVSFAIALDCTVRAILYLPYYRSDRWLNGISP